MNRPASAQRSGRPRPGGAGDGPPEGLEARHTLSQRMSRVATASAGALIVGQLVSLGQTVALARLLTPAEVGMYVAGTVLTAFLTNFVEGGLRSGLVHRDDHLDDSAETVFYATLVSGALMSVASLAAAPLIGIAFHNRTAGLIAASTSGVLLLYSLTSVPEALLQRRFSVMRRLVVGPAVAISFATTAVSIAAVGGGVWSMVAGFYVSHLIWVITLWCICDWRPGRGRASFRLWRELAHYGFPLVLGMFGARVQTMVQSVLVGRGLSEAALGYFRYGQRIAHIPATAIIEIGSVSLFPAFSRIAGDPDRMRSAYLRALRYATFGGAAVTGLLIAAGQPTVVVLFGEKWRGAGTALVAMAGLGLGKAFTCVSEEAIKGAGRTTLLNWYTLVEVASSLGLLLVLIRPLGLVGAGLSVSLSAVIVGAVCIALTRRVVAFSPRALAGAIMPPILAAVSAGAATACFEGFIAHSATHPTALAVLLLASDGAVFAAIYLAGWAALAPTAARDLARLIRNRRRTGTARPAGGVGRTAPSAPSATAVDAGHADGAPGAHRAAAGSGPDSRRRR